MLEFFQLMNWSILQDIQGLRCGVLDTLMPLVTHLGDVGAVWLLAGAALTLTKKYRKYGFAVLAAVALCFVAGNLVLKSLVARPRPCWLDPNVRLLIANETDFSFPSGHALASFAAAAVLARADRRFGIAAFALAALIALSRLYLYVHFPSDVLAGAALGVGLGFAALAITRRLSRVRAFEKFFS